MTKKTLWEEYLICQERGHATDGTSYRIGNRVHYSCRFCKTNWWVEEVYHYSNEPRNPDEEVQTGRGEDPDNAGRS